MQIVTPALILSCSPHGEGNGVMTVFSETEGKIRGYVKGIKRKQADIQPGNLIQLTWNRRLEHQLGSFGMELTKATAARHLQHPVRLQCLRYITEAINLYLPEAMAYPAFYQITLRFLQQLDAPGLPHRLAVWELQLLATVGYGLSLTLENAVPCASGTPLAYVSPNTGRAVSLSMGEPYRDRLLSLPAVFGGLPQEDEVFDLAVAFRLTDHFLRHAIPGEKKSNLRALTVELLLGEMETMVKESLAA